MKPKDGPKPIGPSCLALAWWVRTVSWLAQSRTVRPNGPWMVCQKQTCTGNGYGRYTTIYTARHRLWRTTAGADVYDSYSIARKRQLMNVKTWRCGLSRTNKLMKSHFCCADNKYSSKTTWWNSRLTLSLFFFT
jgi:hypothetical protein